MIVASVCILEGRNISMAFSWVRDLGVLYYDTGRHHANYRAYRYQTRRAS